MSIKIINVPPGKLISTIKLVRSITGLHLVDCKKLLDQRPNCVIYPKDPKECAELLKEIGVTYIADAIKPTEVILTLPLPLEEDPDTVAKAMQTVLKNIGFESTYEVR